MGSGGQRSVGARARRWWPIAAAGTGSLSIAVIVLLIGGFGSSDASPGSAIEQRTAELERQERERDHAQILALNEAVSTAIDDLLPVLDGMATALPANGDTASGAVDATAIGTWRAAVIAADETLGDPPSGSTAINVARSGFQLALNQLYSAIALCESATQADDERRGELLQLAGQLQTHAVVAWSLAATQLDVVNIEAGNGHTHLYLPAPVGSGAFTPDGAPDH